MPTRTLIKFVSHSSYSVYFSSQTKNVGAKKKKKKSRLGKEKKKKKNDDVYTARLIESDSSYWSVNEDERMNINACLKVTDWWFSVNLFRYDDSQTVHFSNLVTTRYAETVQVPSGRARDERYLDWCRDTASHPFWLALYGMYWCNIRERFRLSKSRWWLSATAAWRWTDSILVKIGRTAEEEIERVGFSK